MSKKLVKIIFIILINLITVPQIVIGQKAETIPAKIAVDELGNSYLAVKVQFNTANVNISPPTNYAFLTQTDIRVKQPTTSGLSTRTTIINGVRNQSIETTVYFPLSVNSSGERIIPSLMFELAGKTYKTQPLRAFLDKPVEPVKLELSSEIRQAYPQQGIVIKGDLYISQIKEYSFQGGNIDFRNVDNINPEHTVGETTKLNINRGGYRLYINESSDTIDFVRNGYKNINGTRYSRYTGWFKVFAKEPGTVRLGGSLTLNAVYKRGRGVFADTMNIKADISSLTLSIKDFPNVNKPKSFNGAVGKYAISAKVDKVKVRVGEPIKLTVIIQGDGIIENVKRPELDAIKSFTKNFKLAEETAPGEIKNNKINYTYTIRAVSEDIKEIPPIPFSFFNVSKAIYDTTYSKSIPISVAHSKIVTGDDIVTGGGSNNTERDTRQELISSRGILSNYNGYEALVDRQINPMMFLIILISPLAYVILYFIVKKKRRFESDIAIQRFKGAKKKADKFLSEAEKNLGNSTFYERVAEGLMNYISDKFNLGQGEMTETEIDEVFNSIQMPDEKRNNILNSLKEVFKACEFGRFAYSEKSDVSEQQALIKTTKETIKKIELIQKLNRK